MPRDYDVKITRNTMTISISNGLSKQSSTIIFDVQVILFVIVIIVFVRCLGPNQATAAKPHGLEFKLSTTFVIVVRH
jgi:hypothetical protein